MSRLVVLFADEDALRFVQALITRGQGHCSAPFEVAYLRHPGRDPRVAKDPVPFLRETGALQKGHRYLVLWDHDGSNQHRPSAAVEADVCRTFEGAGIPQADVEAIAFVPELEAVYGVAWDRVHGLFSELGKPADSVPFDGDLPKESLDAARKRHGIKRLDPHLHEQLGERLPLGKLKSEPDSPLHRISQALQTWFPKATEQ